MKKNIQPVSRKLNLHTETVRALSTIELGHIAGASIATAFINCVTANCSAKPDCTAPHTIQ